MGGGDFKTIILLHSILYVIHMEGRKERKNNNTYNNKCTMMLAVKNLVSKIDVDRTACTAF